MSDAVQAPAARTMLRHAPEIGAVFYALWNLGLLGAFATAIAPLNWANHRLGYWLNLGVVSAADVGFIVAILGPGYIRLAEGIGGPALWLPAATFSTVGRLRAHWYGRVA